MEAARTSETLVNFYQTTRCYNPEDSNLHTHRRENLKSYFLKFSYELWKSLSVNWTCKTWMEFKNKIPVYIFFLFGCYDGVQNPLSSRLPFRTLILKLLNINNLPAVLYGHMDMKIRLSLQDSDSQLFSTATPFYNSFNPRPHA
jgi:hypothetical protein